MDSKNKFWRGVMVGVLVTALVMTLLADRMGRRPVETAPVSG